LAEVGREETGHQLLDFLVLGEEDLGWGLLGLERGFFFTPIPNWAQPSFA